jgi:hypothetical protein
MRFPVYRKYPNNKSYFKVLDTQRFEEIQIVGSKLVLYHIEAKIMPDHFLIDDMIHMKDSRWIAISEEEYDALRSLI